MSVSESIFAIMVVTAGGRRSFMCILTDPMLKVVGKYFELLEIIKLMPKFQVPLTYINKILLFTWP